MTTFERTTLGRTGMAVGRLGISASYGVPAAAVERAFEQGVNYLYWGSWRRDDFGVAIRNLRRHREKMALVVQSYSPIAGLLGWSVERALRRLDTDYIDVLLLGLWNRPVPPRITSACHNLRERGLVRHLAFSTHHRPRVAQSASSADFGVVHFRYNAVHAGAENDVFPLLPANNRPGIVTFTTTCWGQLLDRRRIPQGETAPTATDCYRFVLTNPAVDVCMSGPANAAQAEAALEALRRGPMDEEKMAWMRRVGAAIYHKRRS